MCYTGATDKDSGERRKANVMGENITSDNGSYKGVKLFGAQKWCELARKESVPMSNDDDRRIAELFSALTPENQEQAIEISAALLAARLASSSRQETVD